MPVWGIVAIVVAIIVVLPLVAPVSGRRCAAWKLEVTQRNHHQYGSSGAAESTIADASNRVGSSEEGHARRLLLEPNEKSNIALIVRDDREVVAINPMNPAPGFRLYEGP
jgi:hypothetical protein